MPVGPSSGAQGLGDSRGVFPTFFVRMGRGFSLGAK